MFKVIWLESLIIIFTSPPDGLKGLILMTFETLLGGLKDSLILYSQDLILTN